MSINKPDSTRKFRFVAVGIINTSIDFGVLFLMRSIGLPTIPANIISTFAAFCFSFFANRKYTFKSTGGNIKRELLLFIIVTLFGLWVIQTAVIAILTPVIGSFIHSNDIATLIAKLAATATSLVWNYVMYARVVFRKTT